jgi:hypothetical protein
MQHCYSAHKSKGLCASHYKAQQRLGAYDAPNRPTCRMEGCNSVQRFKELCGRHYQIERRADTQRALNGCSVEDCPERNYREGHCKPHYLERYPKIQTRIPDCRRPKCTRAQVRYQGCELHWRNYQPRKIDKTKTSESCCETECANKRFAMDRCQLHYNQWKVQVNKSDDFWSFVKEELKLA